MGCFASNLRARIPPGPAATRPGAAAPPPAKMFDKLPAFNPPDNHSAGAVALRATPGSRAAAAPAGEQRYPPGPSLGYPRVSPYPRGLPHIHLTYHTPSLQCFQRVGCIVGHPVGTAVGLAGPHESVDKK